MSYQGQEEEKLSLRHIVKRAIEKSMGKALDYGRMSEMSDRAFEQYERTIKKEFNGIINYTLELLEDEGFIEDNKE